MVAIFAAKGKAMRALTVETMDGASGTARDPVTKSFCISTTSRAALVILVRVKLKCGGSPF